MLASVYQADVSSLIPLGSKNHVWFSSFTAEGIVIANCDFRLLTHCIVPRTIEGHAAAIVNVLTSGSPQRQLLRVRLEGVLPLSLLGALDLARLDRKSLTRVIARQLQALVCLGLLRSVRYSRQPDRDVDQISKIGIITRDRPVALERSIRSHMGAIRHFGRPPLGYVVDGSTDIATRSRTVAGIGRGAAASQGEIIYIGLREKLKLREKLRGSAPDDVLTFCLFGIEGARPQTGANRNCLMLAAIDEKILSVDDDTTNRSLRAEPRSGIRFVSTGDVQEYDFGSADCSLQDLTTEFPADVFSIHERSTGRILSDIIGEYESDIEYESLSPTLARAVRDAHKFCVGVTISGAVGQSGTYSPVALLTLRGQSLSNLVRSSASYDHAIAADTLLRQSAALTITDNPWCMMTSFSIDHRVVSLPFLPVFRNQDGLFAQICRSCFPKMLLAHSPSVVSHERMDKADRLTIPAGAIAIRIADLIASLLPISSPGRLAFTPDRCLATLGKDLVTMSEWPDADLEGLLLSRARDMLSNRYQSLSEQLGSNEGKRPFFRNDILNALSEIRSVITRASCWIPEDLPGFVAPGERMQFLKSLLKSFGSLIEYWPSIVEKMRRIKADGGATGEVLGQGSM